MRELDAQNKLNKRMYFTFCSIVIFFIISGLFTTFLRHEHWVKLMIHSFFAFTVSILSLYYPFKETNLIRALLIFSITLYFYALFLLYPDTTSTIALIYFAPIISVVLFNRTIFASVLMFNLLVGTSLLIGLSLSNYRDIYSSVTKDVVGNLINFWVCEVIICLIFGFMAKRMDRIKEYFQRIQQAERLNSVGLLAASVAHEIRNPLTVVRGFLQLSKEKTISQEHFKLMIEELDRAEMIIVNYLSLLKPQYQEANLTDVEIEIRAVTGLLYPFSLITKNEIQVNTVEGLWVRVPSNELKQVLTNIIKNALESMKKNGVIFVKGYKSNGYVVVEVIDTGIGMNNKEVKGLGTPFFSLKQKGTGIGLTICFDIINKYKGQIKIHSEKSIGTKVQIFLPLYSIPVS